MPAVLVPVELSRQSVALPDKKFPARKFPLLLVSMKIPFVEGGGVIADIRPTVLSRCRIRSSPATRLARGRWDRAAGIRVGASFAFGLSTPARISDSIISGNASCPAATASGYTGGAYVSSIAGTKIQRSTISGNNAAFGCRRPQPAAGDAWPAAETAALRITTPRYDRPHNPCPCRSHRMTNRPRIALRKRRPPSSSARGRAAICSSRPERCSADGIESFR